MRSKFFFLFIGWEPTMWPANNCLQKMVCSCAMPSNCVWLQIIFCTCVKETVLSSFLRSLLGENGRSLHFPRIFIKKTNSVIEWSNNYFTFFFQNRTKDTLVLYIVSDIHQMVNFMLLALKMAHCGCGKTLLAKLMDSGEQLTMV